jgi:RNA-directed DNA polymerase
MVLEKEVEPIFHPDSFGYRPGKGALQAVGKARERCWRYRWVLDLDIKGFFDTIDHELMMKALRKHMKLKWVILYIERRLKAKMKLPTGSLEERIRGTPQGGVISPLLANLFLHYAFDAWMQRVFPEVAFERYADDIIVHCKNQGEAEKLKTAITRRMEECHLQIHPEKTQIIYCNNGCDIETQAKRKFDFLGYTFGPRSVRTKAGKRRLGFLPAISDCAAKAIRQEIRRWRVPQRTPQTLESIASYANPRLRGWANYYGKYYRSKLDFTFGLFNFTLSYWAMNKFKKLRGRPWRSKHWLCGVAARQPGLFYHWKLGVIPTIKQ